MNNPANIRISEHALDMWEKRFNGSRGDQDYLAALVAGSTLVKGKRRANFDLYMKARSPGMRPDPERNRLVFFSMSQEDDILFVVRQTLNQPWRWLLITMYRISEIDQVAERCQKPRKGVLPSC